jgi:ubiquinol-cytochrome c reductase cytochrome c1 subunit
MFARFASFSAFRVAAPALSLAGVAAVSTSSSKCSGEDHIPSLNFGWSHHGALASFDYASIRRGFQVYRQVCASCHSVQGIAFRSLVGVTHDEAAMKKIAETYEIVDGCVRASWASPLGTTPFVVLLHLLLVIFWCLVFLLTCRFVCQAQRPG